MQTAESNSTAYQKRRKRKGQKILPPQPIYNFSLSCSSNAGTSSGVTYPYLQIRYILPAYLRPPTCEHGLTDTSLKTM